MIIRIVKMTFKQEEVSSFVNVFYRNCEKIKSFKGCSAVKLLKDVNSDDVYFTYSHWNSEADLNNYRNSEFFKSVWIKTKALFSEKPEAWSLETCES